MFRPSVEKREGISARQELKGNISGSYQKYAFYRGSSSEGEPTRVYLLRMSICKTNAQSDFTTSDYIPYSIGYIF
jgi:hypothetical protein